MKTYLTKAVILALAFTGAASAQQWTFQGGGQTNNGSVQIKSVDGSSSATISQNPTGAAVRPNQSAVTQAPVVLMQSSAKLPIVTKGNACNGSTDQVGINADLTVLYSCQTGVWREAYRAVGVNQTWQNMTSLRSLGVNYLNNTGGPIQISVRLNRGSQCDSGSQLWVNNMLIAESYASCVNHASTMTAPIPDGSLYRVERSMGGNALSSWYELR